MATPNDFTPHFMDKSLKNDSINFQLFSFIQQIIEQNRKLEGITIQHLLDHNRKISYELEQLRDILVSNKQNSPQSNGYSKDSIAPMDNSIQTTNVRASNRPTTTSSNTNTSPSVSTEVLRNPQTNESNHNILRHRRPFARTALHNTNFHNQKWVLINSPFKKLKKCR